MNKKNLSILLFLLLQSFSLQGEPLIQYIPMTIDLEKAMQMAQSYSFAVKTVENELNNAQHQTNFALTQIGPSFNSSATKNWYDHNNTFSDVNNHGEGNSSSTYSLTATEPLTGLFSGAFKIGQAYSTLHASDLNLVAAKINARLEAAQAYISVQQSLRALEAKKAAMQFAQETYKTTQILFDTGSVEKTKIDVLQTKAEAATARLAEVAAQKELQIALVSLAVKIGLQDAHFVKVSLEQESLWEKLNPPVPLLAKALQQALKARPEINAADENLSASELEVDQSYFNYLPQVNLFATYSKSSNDMINMYPDSNVNEAIYGINLNWSIWDGGVKAAQISELLKVKSQASIAQEKIIQTVTEDVQNALNNLIAAIKSLDDAKEAAQSYEDSFQLATKQYKTGDYSAINLIETQNKMTAAQVTLANVRSDLDFSWIKLQATLGEYPHVTKE